MDDERDFVESVISADLYCHKLCRLSYAYKYERANAESLNRPIISNNKHVLFTRALPYIDTLLMNGECCTMSDIVEFASSLVEEGELLTRDIKQLLMSHYGESVTICNNSRVNESDIFFSSDINAADLAIKLNNQDIMKEAGTKLREALINVDFGLQDSFCDSTDLKASWERTMMPSHLLTFLAALFNTPNHKLFRSSAGDLEELLQPLDDDEVHQTEDQHAQHHIHDEQHPETQQENWVSNHRGTQLHCLFQILVYNIHNGVKRTPLHMLLGHALYARDRRRSLLTAFSRIVACTSYQTITTARSLLASYAVKCSEDGETPIPSTLTREDYTMAGMDNSDYADRTSLSGTHCLHYAALVLFQDATVNRSLHKPQVSSTGLSRDNPIRQTKLPCQEVPPHFKPVIRPALPPDMIIHPENKEATLLDMETSRMVAAKREFLISLVRLVTSTEDPHIWTAVHTLVSSAVVPLMRVGFLPVIPRPITDRATVRHCLTNFQSVRQQLNQTSMAVWCDEGVFAQAADIYLHEPEQFKELFLCLGPFHWTRVLLRCQGKLLRGSGLDDALIECAVSGPGVIESVLNGSHYVRALTGMLIVEDMIRSLQWEMFWQHKDKTDFPVLTQVMTLQTTLTARQRCPELFDTLTGQVNMLQHEFLEFEQECEAKSELCRFFGLWLQMAAIVKNAVVADREGNWNLHVATTEDSMKIFAEFDCMNYLRHWSWYLEQIKVLEFTHPDLYRRFAMGQWVVRDRPGWFCAVGGDMKVEQTIQHALSTTRRLTFNQNVAKLLDFVLERQNPYSLLCSVPVPLHNLLTKLAVDREVAARLLKCLEYGEIVYRSYRRERLVEKMKKIRSTIPKCKLPKFIDQPHTAPSTVQKDKMDISPKDVAEAQRNMDMAKERGMEVRQILAHDVLSDSTLFDGDLPAHANKAKLVAEIEPLLDPSEWNQTSTLATHVVVDFMSKMRQMPLAQFRTFGDVINAIIVSATHICRESEFVHLVLDSYIEMSVKEGERLRRTDFAGINIVGMNEDTPIPRQLDKLWASEENKRNLQLLVRDIVCGLGNCSATAIVSSVVSDGEVLPAKTADGEEIPDLLNWIEEADARLVEHVDWKVRVKQCKRIVIVSNDTDTFALLLHYTPHFQAMGLKEIWQQFGTGEKRRMLALHQAVAKLGAPLAKTMIKAHILSGYDCMDKVGTKHAAMASDPVQYLTNFGEALPMSEQDAALSEKYLVRVWAGVRSTVTADTFDQLRVEHYTSASAGIDALPPTSSVERTLWYIATI